MARPTRRRRRYRSAGLPRLIWSPRALADVSRLHRFLFRKDSSAARRAAKAIRAGVEILAQHPDAGKQADGMPAEFRDWQIPFGRRGYIALYQHDGDVVLIVAVRHFQKAGY